MAKSLGSCNSGINSCQIARVPEPTEPGMPLTIKIGLAPVLTAISRRRPFPMRRTKAVRPPAPGGTANQGLSTLQFSASVTVAKNSPSASSPPNHCTKFSGDEPSNSCRTSFQYARETPNPTSTPISTRPESERASRSKAPRFHCPGGVGLNRRLPLKSATQTARLRACLLQSAEMKNDSIDEPCLDLRARWLRVCWL